MLRAVYAHGRRGDYLEVLAVTMLAAMCLLALLLADPELAGDWRARHAVAEQLSAVAGMVSSPQVAYCLWPLLLSLARDLVFAVRAAAAQQAGQLLVHLPDEQLPAEQGDAQKAAAAAAALKTAASETSQDAPASDTAEASSSTAPVSATSEAAEHEIAAVVATHAVGTGPQPEPEQDPQPQQQQQQEAAGDGGPGPRLRWMRRGLTSGLSQLQQQVCPIAMSVSKATAAQELGMLPCIPFMCADHNGVWCSNPMYSPT